MKKILIITVSVLSFSCYSQLINSNQSTIAEFYDGNVKSIELNGGKVSAQFKIHTWLTKFRYKKQPEIKSAEKNNSLFLNLGLTNTGNFLNLNKFDFEKNNGYTFGATFQHSFSEIYLAADSLNYNPHSLRAFTISLDYQRDKFNNFNPVTEEFSKTTPDKLVLKAGWSLYKFNYREKAKHKYTWIPSFYGKINLIGYNENSLQNYLIDNNTFTNGEVIFTNGSSFDGKYGVIDNNIKSAQISFSSPIVPDKFFSWFPIISPIPYISYEVFDNSKPRWNGGFAFGFLTSPIVDSKSIKKDGGTYRKFNVPSYLSLGVDWNYQDGQGSKPNYFVAGSIKFN